MYAGAAAFTVLTMAATIETLRAVHHPTRRRILEHLHLDGPAQVGTLARDLGEQVGSISHHLRMLERVGLVARVPELEIDGRTSWWRMLERTVSWSVEDFETPADRVQARAAEKANIEHHLARLTEWKRSQDRAPAEWRRAAFANDQVVRASAEELAELDTRLRDVLATWRAEVAERSDDGRDRQPVMVFMHGFRTRS